MMGPGSGGYGGQKPHDLLPRLEAPELRCPRAGKGRCSSSGRKDCPSLASGSTWALGQLEPCCEVSMLLHSEHDLNAQTLLETLHGRTQK